MTQEQKERLTSWYLNILVTYRIDFFRGSVFSDIVEIIVLGDKVETYIDRAKKICSGADRLGFAPDQKDYTELLRELREIVNEVPLSDTAQSAITYVFGGEWQESIEALDKLKSERNEQN
nr:MAG TPA: hydrolase [Caudoviricetes sp.]